MWVPPVGRCDSEQGYPRADAAQVFVPEPVRHAAALLCHLALRSYVCQGVRVRVPAKPSRLARGPRGSPHTAEPDAACAFVLAVLVVFLIQCNRPLAPPSAA